jgi:sulfatase modifying factor 1
MVMRSDAFIRSVAVLATVATAGCNAIWGNDWGDLAPADASADAGGLGGAGGVGGVGVPDSSTDNGNTGGTGGTGGSSGSGAAGGLGGVDGGDASTTDGKGGVDAGTDGAGVVSDSGGDTSATDAAPDVARVNPDGGTFVPPNAQSCVQAEGGTLLCNTDSCCASIIVPGGQTFMQGGSPEYTAPAHSSTVSSFALDKYEVTVGRFRKFVEAYVGNGVDGGTATVPAEGAGANLNVPVAGDASNNGTGWKSAWDTLLPADRATFKTLLNGGSYQTWTDYVGANENKTINYASWYEAFAFCIWDGGRLPTESEWEYAAAGGGGADGNRIYPWGSTAPDCTYANFNSVASPHCGPDATVAVAPVGSYAAGNGRWGHADLAGNVWEWTFDWDAPYSAAATNNYANTTASSDGRVARGGDFNYTATFLRAAFRGGNPPDDHNTYVGLRCARSAP